MTPPRGTEGRVSLFAMLLACAGLPLYIHLPRFAATDLGIGLSTLGGLLIGLRLIDVVQDPFLGALVDRYRHRAPLLATLACLGIGLGFLMLFALPPQGSPVVWLSVSLVVLFSAYSLATILFYARTTALAGTGAAKGVLRIASFREAGSLVGIVLAAVAPVALAKAIPGDGYAPFGVLVCAVALVLPVLTRPLWTGPLEPEAPMTMAGLRSSGVGRLLFLAFVNALPVAITSTLFLFFVEDGLRLPRYAGGFLVLFFASAGLAVPIWSRAIRRLGTRRVLILAMLFAIAGFAWAAALGPGDAAGFAAVCVVSGGALAADMVVLPALFSTSLARAGLRAGRAFGLWSFATKLTLAMAAGTVLPALDLAGFHPGSANGTDAIFALKAAYCVLPCLLKVLAIAVVWRLPDSDFD